MNRILDEYNQEGAISKINKTEIKFASYQREYEGIVGGIVFMNLRPDTTEDEQVMLGQSEFYIKRGQDIATIVKIQTGELLINDTTIFLTGEKIEGQNIACRLMGNGIGIQDDINIINTRYLRKNHHRTAKCANELIDVCKKNVRREVLAIVILTSFMRYRTSAIGLGFNGQRRDEKNPHDVIKEGGINRNEILYFPYNTKYI